MKLEIRPGHPHVSEETTMSKSNFTVAERDYALSYENALNMYLSSGKDSDLRQAFELGMQLLRSGKSLRDVTQLHNMIISKKFGAVRGDSGILNILPRALSFLSESLQPFEATYQSHARAVDNLEVEVSEREKASEDLERNDPYFRSLGENSLDLTTVVGPDGIVRYCSPSCEKVLGYTPDEMTGRSFFEFVHPDDINSALEFFEQGKNEDGTAITVEYRYRHKNGFWVILESIGKNLVADPHVAGVVISSRDITDRRSLEEMRRRYEFIANASKELMTLVNREYCYEAANEALCAAVNRKQHEIVGKRVGEIWGDESFEKLLKPYIDNAFRGNEEYNQAWFDLPSLGGRFLETSFYPYRDLMGKVTHVAVITRDITERKRTEDEIIKSHMRLAEAQSVAHVGSWELNTLTGTFLCSEEMMNIMGQSPDKTVLSYEQFISQVLSPDKDKVTVAFESVLSRGDEFGFNCRIERGDGTVRVVHNRGRVVSESGRKSVKIIGTTQDLTEQELAREAVTAYEIRYRRLFETSKDGVLLIDASTGKVTDLNPLLVDLLGYDKAEFIGQELSEIDAAAGIPRSREILRHVREQEHLLADDLILRTKSGETVHLEFVSISYLAGETKIIQCHFWDITERMQLEEALHSSEERFRSLIENATDVIAVIEPDGRFKYVSPSVTRVLGYRPEELMGQSVLEMVTSETADNLSRIIKRVASSNDGLKDSIEISLRALNGSVKVVEATTRNLLKVPPVMGILLNVRDITEKKVLQNELKTAAWQREEDLRKFAMSVQEAQEEERKRIAMELHDDICQRLTAMRLNLTVLQDNVETRKKSYDKQWHSIKKEIDDVAAEVRRISYNLRPSALDHFGIVTALRLICSEMERVQGLKIDFRAGSLLKQHYEPNIEIALFRIAQEALANCAKHSGVNEAEMKLEQTGKVLEFVVSDRGKGFTEQEYLQLIRGENHMGVMNMKERARLIGGECEVQSSPGKGTTIMVRIPITEVEIG